MNGPEAHMISGRRLHLHHGPIDLIIRAWGRDRMQAYGQATMRFQTVLHELMEELDILRQPVGQLPKGIVARRMAQVTTRHSGTFVTPMAAVAGAVADEICSAMCKRLMLDKAYVNNGGDIAIYLGKDQRLTAAIHTGRDAGRVTFDAGQPARGLATSGWQGRSHSLGIADAVTVVAKTAAQADIAATLIANAVDLPHHPAIKRQPANTLSPDSDLGARQVTVAVGPLTKSEVSLALKAGHMRAQEMLHNDLISAATLFLRDQNCTVGGTGCHGITGENNARLQTA